ncbi:hypothetical protein vseg_009941 [Gypsophila vaccaria]
MVKKQEMSTTKRLRVVEEEIVELKAKRISSMLDVDSSPKSLLALTSNESAHGLYDFLLNYRSLMRMQSGMDVPVLCAPFPFLNAALSSPEVALFSFLVGAFTSLIALLFYMKLEERTHAQMLRKLTSKLSLR